MSWVAPTATEASAIAFPCAISTSAEACSQTRFGGQLSVLR